MRTKEENDKIKNATFGKKFDFTEEEIRQQAREFFKKWMHPEEWEKKCGVCDATNCTCNETCIKCNCQF